MRTFLIGPAKLAAGLRSKDLNRVPRGELLGLFKAVDAEVDRACLLVDRTEYDAWLEPWEILCEYFDPDGLMVWPDPDWKFLDATEADTKQMELFG